MATRIERSHPLASLIGAMLVTQACTNTPKDGVRIPRDSAYFIGFATTPSAEVHVQARRWWDGEWVTIATLQAASTVYPTRSPHLQQARYQWYLSARVPSYFFDAAGRVTLRAEQAVGSSWVPMFMYDAAGWQCLVSRYVAAGTGELDAWNAGIECSRTGGAERHQITLHR